MVWAVLWMLPRSYLKRLGARQLALPACLQRDRTVARRVIYGTYLALSVNKRNDRWRLANSQYDRNNSISQWNSSDLNESVTQLHRTVNWHYFVFGKQPVRLQNATASTYTRMYIKLLFQSNSILTEIESKFKYNTVDSPSETGDRGGIFNTMIRVN